MTNAQMEREYFWKNYQKILDELGNPFKLRVIRDSDGVPRHYAILNYYNADNIYVDFSVQKGMVRCGVCMNDDDFFDCFLLKRREGVEAALGFCCSWLAGEKSENTRRIIYNIQIVPYDRESYIKAINESIEKLKMFLKVVGPVLSMDPDMRKQITRNSI